MSAGRVCTGFSKPYVANYSAAGNVVTYSNVQLLARGVSVSVEVEDAGADNNFYADNVIAESIAGVFTGGSATFTVDGLLTATKKMILGLPTADASGWTAYGDEMAVPYVGVGFIARYQNAGVVSYVPYVLAKAKFAVPADAAATQGEDIEWQTQELSATLFRDDTTNKNWKYEGQEYSTETLAEAALKTKLGYVEPDPEG